MAHALEYLGFLAPDGAPTDALRAWAQYPERRRTILAEAIRRAYANWPSGRDAITRAEIAAVLGPHAWSDGIRRKAERFLASALADLGLLAEDAPQAPEPAMPTKPPKEDPAIPEPLGALARDMLRQYPRWTLKQRDAGLRMFHAALMHCTGAR